ncbi:MAG: hypothetical protein JNJ77_02080 [Planctomycetia bacterium]|nr:hypothetical protein [Planctomycetia bacterium]
MMLGLVIFIFWVIVLAALYSFGQVHEPEDQTHLRGQELQSDKQLQGDIDDN